MFTCKKCNYSTNDKSNFNKHQTTKKHLKRHNKLEENKPSQVGSFFLTQNCKKTTSFDPKLATQIYVCHHCDKSFKSKSHLKRHQTHNCKQNKASDSYKNMCDKLKAEKKEKEELYKQIEELLEENGKMIEHSQQAPMLHTTNNTVNNITNNTINNNITNNIVLNSYGQEDLTHITDSILTQLIKGPGMMISNLAKLIHFNDEKPENMNVYIPNKRDKYVQIYRDDKWNLETKKEAIPDMVDKSYYILDTHYDAIKHTLDNFTKKNFQVIQGAFDSNNKKIIREQCNLVELGMLNNSKKVIQNKNNN